MPIYAMTDSDANKQEIKGVNVSEIAFWETEKFNHRRFPWNLANKYQLHSY